MQGIFIGYDCGHWILGVLPSLSLPSELEDLGEELFCLEKKNHNNCIHSDYTIHHHHQLGLNEYKVKDEVTHHDPTGKTEIEISFKYIHPVRLLIHSILQVLGHCL